MVGHDALAEGQPPNGGMGLRGEQSGLRAGLQASGISDAGRQYAGLLIAERLRARQDICWSAAVARAAEPRTNGGADMLIWPWEDRNRRFSWLKASAFALMLLPAVRSAYLVGAGDYGNSLTIVLEGLTYWSGVWATVILLMALAVTPFATIFRWPVVIDVRRMIGVSALV